MWPFKSSAPISTLILWDFENVTPTESNFDALFEYITKKVQDFAEAEKKELQQKVILCGNVTRLSPRLRNIITMKTHGVDLRDAVDEPKGNAADRKIFEIMNDFSNSNVNVAAKGNALIALVSGDRDFAKVLGSLKERKFHVFVFAKKWSEDLYKATSKTAAGNQHFYELEFSQSQQHLEPIIKSEQCWQWQNEEHLRGVKDGKISCMFSHPSRQCKHTLPNSTVTCRYGAPNCNFGHPLCGSPCRCVGTKDENKHHPPLATVTSGTVGPQPKPKGERKTGQMQCAHWNRNMHDQEKCKFYHPSKACRDIQQCKFKADNCFFAHPFCRQNNEGTPLFCQCGNNKDPQLNHLWQSRNSRDPSLQRPVLADDLKELCIDDRKQEYRSRSANHANATLFTPSNFVSNQMNHFRDSRNARDPSRHQPDDQEQGWRPKPANHANKTYFPSSRTVPNQLNHQEPEQPRSHSSSPTLPEDKNTIRAMQSKYGINEATAKILVITEGYNERTVTCITQTDLDRLIEERGLQRGQAALLREKLNVSSNVANPARNPSVPAQDQHHTGPCLDQNEMKAIKQLQASMKPSYNVLLLGETGSGKSTLINYFANYFNDNTTLTANSKLRIAIPNKHYPHATEHFKNSEHNVHDSGASKTKECTSYDFSVIGSRSKFVIIDTPGMADTRGTATDDHNIDIITAAAEQTGELSAIIIVVNGTNPRMTTNLKTTIVRMRGNIPNNVLKNIIVVFTNCARITQVNFDLNNLGDLRPPSANVFCMSNSALSSDRSTWDSDDLNHMQAQWKKSMNVLNDIVCRVLQLDPCTTGVFKDMREKRMQLQQMLHKALLDIKNLQKLQDTIERATLCEKDIQTNCDKYSQFKVENEIEVEELIPTPYWNTLCVVHKEKACHEQCGLSFTEQVGHQIFRGCACMNGTTCTQCGCGHDTHFHAKHHVKKEKKKVEKILDDVRNQFNAYNEKLSDVRKEKSTAASDEQANKQRLQNLFDEIRALCYKLKEICTGFNFVDELHAIIQQMQTDARCLTQMGARQEADKLIKQMEQLANELSRK